MGTIVNCDGDDPLRFTEEALDEVKAERDGCGLVENAIVLKLCDEHERLEAQLVTVNGALSGAIRRHDALSAEHARVCSEYALLAQESGREGRELDRLEGLLRAWHERPDDDSEVWREAVRLAKEGANG